MDAGLDAVYGLIESLIVRIIAPVKHYDDMSYRLHYKNVFHKTEGEMQEKMKMKTWYIYNIQQQHSDPFCEKIDPKFAVFEQIRPI